MKFELLCPGCNSTLQAKEEWVGKRAKCKYCGEKIVVSAPPANSLTAADEVEEEDDVFDLKGDKLGMSLTEFKKKHHRKVKGDNAALPWCSDSRPGIDFTPLGSEAYFQQAGLINCQLHYPFEENYSGWKPQTVGGAPTLLLRYHFIDEKLYEITVAFDRDDFDPVQDALIAKYGDPTYNFGGGKLMWKRPTCTLAFTNGKTKRTLALLMIWHDDLKNVAKSRKPGPAVGDL